MKGTETLILDTGAANAYSHGGVPLVKGTKTFRSTATRCEYSRATEVSPS